MQVMYWQPSYWKRMFNFRLHAMNECSENHNHFRSLVTQFLLVWRANKKQQIHLPPVHQNSNRRLVISNKRWLAFHNMSSVHRHANGEALTNKIGESPSRVARCSERKPPATCQSVCLTVLSFWLARSWLAGSLAGSGKREKRASGIPSSASVFVFDFVFV